MGVFRFYGFRKMNCAGHEMLAQVTAPMEARYKSDRPFRHKPSIMDQVDYRLAETVEQKEEIYRLRYRAYLREGAVPACGSGAVFDSYDEAPNHWTFGVYHLGVLMGSIRIGVLTRAWRTSASGGVFADILDPLLDSGSVLVDPSRFVADPEKSRQFPYLPLVSARLGWVAGAHFKADLGLSIVRSEHQPFYRRLFLSGPVAEPRSYPGLLKPVGLLAASYRQVADEVLRRHPFLESTAFERRMLFKDSEARMRTSPQAQERSLESVA
jgi:hypothetical protein